MQEETSKFIAYQRLQFSEDEMVGRSQEYYQFLDLRRSIRAFSDKAVPFEIIENIIMAASTAPSGAHKQPWTFCVVSDPEIKKTNQDSR